MALENVDYVRIEKKTDTGFLFALRGGRKPVFISNKFLGEGRHDEARKVLRLPDWLAKQKLDESRQPPVVGTNDWAWELLPLRPETPSRPHKRTEKSLAVSCQLVRLAPGQAARDDDGKDNGFAVRVYLPLAAIRDGNMVARRVAVSSALRSIERKHPDIHKAILSGGEADWVVRRLLNGWPVSFERLDVLLPKKTG